MSDAAMNAAEIIDRLGGHAAVAEATGAKLGTVYQWSARNRFPAAKWPELVALSGARRPWLTFEMLRNLSPAKARSSAAASEPVLA